MPSTISASPTCPIAPPVRRTVSRAYGPVGRVADRQRLRDAGRPDRLTVSQPFSYAVASPYTLCARPSVNATRRLARASRSRSAENSVSTGAEGVNV